MRPNATICGPLAAFCRVFRSFCPRRHHAALAAAPDGPAQSAAPGAPAFDGFTMSKSAIELWGIRTISTIIYLTVQPPEHMLRLTVQECQQ